MPEYTATNQFIPADTDLSWNTVTEYRIIQNAVIIKSADL